MNPSQRKAAEGGQEMSFMKSPENADKLNKWVGTQKKAFKNWANYYLKERNLQIQNLEEDLKDGILLINLVEILTGKSVGRYNRNPKLKVQKINNINLALDAIRNSRHLHVSASAEDIADGNIKMLLGIVWTLVHEFQLQSFSPEGSNKEQAKDLLLDWVIAELQDYKDLIDLQSIKRDFPSSFKDGKVFSLLVHKRKPSAIDIGTLDKKSAHENLAHALDTAEKDLGVPKLIDVEDIVTEKPDEQSMLTYISYFRSTSNNPFLQLGESIRETADKQKESEKRIEEISRQQKEQQEQYEKKMRDLEEELKKLREGGSKAANEEEIKKYKKKKKELKEQNEELRRQLEKQKLDNENLQNKLKAADSEAESYKTKYKEEKEKNKQLQQENEEKERLLRSRGDVLDSKASSEERLRSENEQLKKKLEKLTAGGSSSATASRAGGEGLMLEIEFEQDMASIQKQAISVEVAELKELNHELELRLEKESTKAKKLEEELEKAKKEYVALEVELESMQEENKTSKQALMEAERRAVAREPEVEDRVEVTRDLGDSALLLNMEGLIRQLYWRDGASLNFEDLQEEHRENVQFVETVNDLRETVSRVIDSLCANFYDRDPIPRKPGNVTDIIMRLRDFRADLKKEKNSFVKACNELGIEYSDKSGVEHTMREWRDKLVEIRKDPSQCRPDNKELLKDLDEVRTLLQDDDRRREEVKACRKDRLSARNNVQDLIDSLRGFIHDDVDEDEKRRLQTLLRDLKDANKQLQTSSKGVFLAQDINLTREERTRIGNVIKIMVENYKQVFRDFTDSPVNDQVHPMVKESIKFLEKKGLHIANILGDHKQNAKKIENLKAYFYEGHDVELLDSSDPFSIAELLKEYFRDLPQPLLTYKRYDEFDRINDLSSGLVLNELRLHVAELPKVRRATLTVLVAFLQKVAVYADQNKMTVTRLADIFGPLLLRPFRA
ncbi:alpha-actinin [Balamuthia mandrillaris]